VKGKSWSPDQVESARGGYGEGSLALEKKIFRRVKANNIWQYYWGRRRGKKKARSTLEGTQRDVRGWMQKWGGLVWGGAKERGRTNSGMPNRWM